MADMYIHHHMGLGDMVHMNGMVRRILKDEEYDNVHVFSKNCYKEMTEWMYRDDPRIKVIGIDENGNERSLVDQILSRELMGTDNKYLRVGHEFYKEDGNENGPMPCDMLFYDQVGLPYSSRFDDCYWERDMKEEERVYNKLVPAGEDYIFVHDDPNRTEIPGGFVITNEEAEAGKPGPVGKPLVVVRNDMSESIFHLGMLLENAKQIHVMESSIRCMMEFLKPSLLENGVELYFHNFRGGPYYNEETGIWNGTSLPFEMVRPTAV